MASSSSSLNWLYDVFVSFRGEDIRKTFLNHVFKEFDRKLINFFKDNEMVKSQSLRPVLEKAIRSSRIAVVVFSRNYASSSWCLNELLEIVDCNIKIIIPIFYGVDPSDVRNHTGYFGKIFEETCKKNNTEEVKDKWKKALTNVANMVGFDFANWDTEAKMIEEIANDVLRKLLSTSSKDFENFVGIEDHMAKMSELLQLESEEVRMVGIWGSSGIGKTIIARALFNQLPQHFHVSKFVDRSFVSRSKETYHGANPDDHNMKLHLQEQFLSNILGIKDIEIGHLGALRERLHHQKVLIIIDDLDDLMVLEVLADKTQWFGSGSRIIVVTNNRRFLRAHEIVHIYEVSLPTEVQACQMLCQSAFRENYGPEGFEELVVEVTIHAGRLPLGLNVLGCSLRGQDKEYWMDKLRELQNSLEDGIEKILRISYDWLGSNEKTLFRHIACLFNHMEETTIKLLLADSKLSVNTALPNLADRCLIHIRQGYVVMHPLLQAMCIEIVRTQSIDKPEKREFLEDKEEICYVLKEGTGTSKILGISLDTSEIHELQIHKNAFKGMGNLKFLKIYSKIYTLEKEVRLNLPESFAYWPPKLKLLSWERYPMSWLPSGIVLENLVKLEMQESKLEKLWEGVVSVPCLKEMDIRESLNLKEIPDLSMATNLVKLDFGYCSSLVELPSSIRNLNKLVGLDMVYCNSLETLPTGFDLKSLEYINFKGCKKLRTFPEFSTNISCLVLEKTKIEEFPSNLCLENLTELFISIEESDGKEWEGVKLLMPLTTMLSPILTLLKLCYIPSLRELPSSFQNLNQLEELYIGYCRNLETLPTGINLKSLRYLDLQECSLLRSFPEISTNISSIYVERTGIEEVPWRIENFSNLSILSMRYCSSLKCVSLNISKLKHLAAVDFSDCGALTSVDLSGNSSEVAMEADNIDTVPEEASSSLSDDYFPKRLNFTNCFNLDKEAVLQQQSIIFESMILAGEEVPSYFTHRTTGMFPLLDVPLSQPFFRFRVCAVVNAPDGVYIVLNCRFKGKYGNKVCQVKLPNPMVTPKGSHQLLIFDCAIPLNNAPLPLPPVDMHIYLTAGPPGWKLMFSIKGWGIRLLGNCSSPEKLIGYPNPRPWHAGTLLARKSSDSMFRNMLDEEMDLYFTYRTTGNSLYDIPLPHTSQPFFRFTALVEFDCRSSGQLSYFYIDVSCQFKGRSGNYFDPPYQPHTFYTIQNGLRYGVLKCVFPLNEGNAQPNYDHVDIKFQLRNRGDCTSSIIGCGIGFLEDCSSPSPENQIGNPNTLRLVCEADADNTISDGCHETKSSEECEDSGKGYETDQIEDCGGSDRGNETDQPPHVSEANEDNMGYIPLQELVNETEHSKDSADSNVETERSRKRIRKSWRRPKGIDFRARKKLKGVTLMPNVGYGSGHNITYGFKKFKTLLMMHKRTYSAEIAHNVSTKKRKVIVEKALG